MIDISLELAKMLSEYTDDVKEALEETAEEVTTETVNQLKASSPRRTGKYAKAWTRKKTPSGYIIHNKLYYLTHLLENGHAKRSGGRVQGRTHIAPAEQFAINTFEEKVRWKLQ